MEHRRVLAVRASDYGPGSGYVLAGRLVLTSAHLVGPVGTQARVFRVGEKAEYNAEVVWRGTPGARDDGSLLVICDPQWGPGTDAPVRWGRTVTFLPRLPCHTWGVPDAVQSPGSGSGEPVEAGQPSGALSPGNGMARDRYVIDLDGAVPDVLDRERSPWGGLSGAALFCGNLLTGVVTGAIAGWGNRRLTAATAYGLHAAEGFTRVLAEHGVAGPLEPVEFQDVVEPAVAGGDGPVPSPASLLTAWRAVVPFRGREELLADLEAWAADAGRQVAVRLVHGPAGQGKSRLARQLSDRLLGAGWVVAWLRPAAAVADLSVLAKAARATLVVIDYAESRTAQLGALLGELSTRSEGASLRVLLLARTEGWWRDLSADLSAARELIEAASVTQLPELDASEPGRHVAYREAVNAFALALPHVAGQYDTDWAAAAGALPTPRVPDAGVLSVHMTALADLLDAAHPVSAGPGTRDVEDRLLDHEYGYWFATATDQLLIPALSRATLREAMAAAHLCTAVTRQQADKLLAGTPGLADQPYDRRRAVRSWIAALYPATVPGAPWDGLQPDRLAERFVGRYLAGEPELADALTPGATPDQAAQLLTVYARAAAQPAFEHSLDQELTGLVLRHFALLAPAAIAAATRVEHPDPLVRALDQASRDPGTSPEELARLEDLLPSVSHALGDWAVRLTTRVVDQYRAASDSSSRHRSELASALRGLSSRLDAAGRREEALSAITEAVELSRELAEGDPATHLLGLARNLTAQADRLADLGQSEEALGAAAAAVTIIGRLPMSEPEVALSAVGVMDSLSSRLAESGRPEEALASITVSVDAMRQLAEADPALFRPTLAGILGNYSSRLFQLGRWDESMAAASESLRLHRDLAAENPDAFLPILAKGLASSALLTHHSDMSLALITEALGICRRLAEDRRETYLPQLADCLSTLANLLLNFNRPAEALPAATEAVALYRELAQTLPEAFRPDLGTGLSFMATSLAETGRLEESLNTAVEATEIYRQLAELRPAVYRPGYAACLSRLANVQSQVGREEEALASAIQAVTLCRELAEERPETHMPDLATSLRILGARLADLERLTEAASALAEAVDIKRQPNGARVGDSLGVTLADYAVRLHMLGQLEPAAATLTEAAAEFRRLAETDPGQYLTVLAGTQVQAARWWQELDRYEEAVAAAAEAAEAYRQLAADDREEFLPDLAEQLDTLGRLLAEDVQFNEALTVAAESVEIWRRLAADNPGKYLFGLGASLSMLGARLSEADSPDRALAVGEEAVETWRQLVGSNPGRYQPGLAASLTDLQGRLYAAGRPEQGLTAIAEAVELWRLAAVEPQWLPSLPEALDILTHRLDEAGRPGEALAAAIEAVECYRQLVTATEDQYYLRRLAFDLEDTIVQLDHFDRPAEALDLAAEYADACLTLANSDERLFGRRAAQALVDLAKRYETAGRSEESLAAATGAVAAWRQVSHGPDGVEQPSTELADSLETLAAILAKAGRREDAAVAAVEAFETRLRRAAISPESEMAFNASCLAVHAHQLKDLGRPDESLAARAEAVAIQRRLAAANPEKHLSRLADGLSSFATQCGQLGRPAEELAAAEEAVGLYRSLAETDAEKYLPELASGLGLLTSRLSTAGRAEEALAAAEEAVAVYRQLAGAHPDEYTVYLASGLRALLLRFAELGRSADELAVTEEAVGLYRSLAETAPERYLPELASLLGVLPSRLLTTGRAEEALAAAEEAAAAYRQLAGPQPDVYLPWVLSALCTCALVFGHLGRLNEVAGTLAEADEIHHLVTVSHPGTGENELRIIKFMHNWLREQTDDETSGCAQESSARHDPRRPE